MDWILQCLLWVTLTLTSAYRCKQHDGFFDYPHFHDGSQESAAPTGSFGFEFIRPQPHTRRVDHAAYEPRGNYDSHGSYEVHAMDERSAERTNKPSQRMNERSIAVNSGIQRVQEVERRRLQASRTEEAVPRTENSTYKIVNSFPMVYPDVDSRRGQMEDDRPARDSVVFPGPTSKSSSDLVPDVPEQCLRDGICDQVPNYPTELAAKIIAQLGDKRERFHIDELDEPEIAQRIGPAEQNIELCQFREKIVKPHAARDKNDKWYFILNQKDDPLQGYRVEICLHDGATCAQNIAYFHSGYTATCKQKYVQRTMAAIDRAGNIKYDMVFKVPSCCSCVASHKGRK